MLYYSTRSPHGAVSSAQAIIKGLAEDGGLFIPESFPHFSLQQIASLVNGTYVQRATAVLSQFLTDYTKEELTEYISAAYSKSNFAHADVAPVVELGNNLYVLELFHGPTCAFKDFALQLLPHLLSAAIKKTNMQQTVVILVATSGDTGKAALEGFADVEGTKICVFYPDGGTSEIQRLQMTTQSGNNVMVFGVDGNFDDAQAGVKRIFGDEQCAQSLLDSGYVLSSANSINWGRLVPQIAYYFSAYCDLAKAGKIAVGDCVNFAVPTGNFGNILAAYIAKQCGLPIGKLVCASNINNVLTDFMNTGVYSKNRDFHITKSPSMDILVSSNLERLLYLLCKRNPADLSDYMRSLNEGGQYTITQTMLQTLREDFVAGYATEEETDGAIRATMQKYGYLPDTHTAVGLKVAYNYQNTLAKDAPLVVTATASPFKFADSVLSALGENTDESFAMLGQLSKLCGVAPPEKLVELQNKPERFLKVVTPNDMQSAVLSWLHAEVNK